MKISGCFDSAVKTGCLYPWRQPTGLNRDWSRWQPLLKKKKATKNVERRMVEHWLAMDVLRVWPQLLRSPSESDPRGSTPEESHTLNLTHRTISSQASYLVPIQRHQSIKAAIKDDVSAALRLTRSSADSRVKPEPERNKARATPHRQRSSRTGLIRWKPAEALQGNELGISTERKVLPLSRSDVPCCVGFRSEHKDRGQACC